MRPRKGERVLGPYPIGRQWRIVVVGEGGERDSRFYPSEEQAKAAARSIGREFKRSPMKTVGEARDAYERYLLDDKGNKSGSVADAIYRVNAFFPDPEVLLSDLTPQRCAVLYQNLRERKTRTGKMFAVDSHRSILAEAKMLLAWCSSKQKWILRNPAAGVAGCGRRRHGKPQLRIDEARRWVEKATAMADAGEAGAVAALMSLVLGMRASEIVERVVRDLDDEGRLLWIPDAKTEAGKRTLEVPESLQAYLLRLAKGREPQELLFGDHWRDWVRKWVQKICVAAEVPKVTAHGMRGLHSSIALAHGASGHLVATALGHESITTTLQSYANPAAVAGAKQRVVLGVLDGGRKPTG